MLLSIVPVQADELHDQRLQWGLSPNGPCSLWRTAIVADALLRTPSGRCINRARLLATAMRLARLAGSRLPPVLRAGTA